MKFSRGDTCYILENNRNVRAAKVISRQGSLVTIQLVGSCGAIRLKESRLFGSETEAEASRKTTSTRTEECDDGFIDVFAGRRTNRSPHPL